MKVRALQKCDFDNKLRQEGEVWETTASKKDLYPWIEIVEDDKKRGRKSAEPTGDTEPTGETE